MKFSDIDGGSHYLNCKCFIHLLCGKKVGMYIGVLKTAPDTKPVDLLI
ncbi:hypothetical protein HanIR_Chr09g0415411 [Helianthus annuus]|nr:hypothetical protein HanIR_Chr09g0415411 [Helianthus annuus]